MVKIKRIAIGRYTMLSGEVLIHIWREHRTGAWHVKEDGSPDEFGGPYPLLRDAKSAAWDYLAEYA